MRYSKIISPILALSLIAASCSDDNDPAREVDDVIATSALVTFDSCDALLTELNGLAADKVGPYGFDNGSGGFFVTDDVAEESSVDFAGDESFEAASDSEVATRDSGTTKEFSGTNNQENLVDEADIVKTNGDVILAVLDQTLQIIDTDSKEITGTVELPQWNYTNELFLSGNKAVLMSQTDSYAQWENELESEIAFDDAVEEDFIEPGEFFQSTSVVLVDIDKAEIVDSYELRGTYLSGRMVGETMRIVVSNQQPAFDFVYPSGSSNRAEQIAQDANKELVAELTIDDWLPKDSDGNRILECDQVHVPTEFAGFGFVNVVTVTADSGLDLKDSTAVLTSAQEVYSSTERLVLTTPRWEEPGLIAEALGFDSGYQTAVHSFDISNPETTNYVASGQVPGSLLNRYSISEHEGFLRVATTEGSPWSQNGSESMVTVLSEEGSALVRVGQVDDIGRGEAITAARFYGDIAYIVTFRQTDPFYTIDLSDPENPTMLGELKIPGFSSYLHPIDDDTVFAVGTDGDDDGANGQVAASLFDVSDLSDPRLVDKLVISDGGYGYSPVANDARAFQIWENTALVPVSSFGIGDTDDYNGSNALKFIEIDGSNLSFVGEVTHGDISECEGVVIDAPIPVEPFDQPATALAPEATDEVLREIEPAPECYSYPSEIVRSLVVDGEVYSISPKGTLVNDFDSLDEITWIPFAK